MKIKKPVLMKAAAAILPASLALGILLATPNKEASAKLMRTKAGDYGYIFSYVIDTADSNADATDVRITAQEIDKDIVIPERFTDEYGTHYVKSVGNSNMINTDSFFNECNFATDQDGMDILINVDMNGCTKLDTINAYAFYEAPLKKVELSASTKTVGEKAFAACSSSSLRVPNPNTMFLGSYDADYLYKAVGADRSYICDFMADAAAKKYTSNGTKTIRLTFSYDANIAKNLSDRPLQTWAYAPTDATLSDLATLMALPESNSHDFKGYFSGKNGTGTKYYDGKGSTNEKKLMQAPSADMTLYAHMTPKIFTINYHGAEGYSTAKRTHGTPLTLPTPSKTGYGFGGWYTTGDFETGTLVSEIKANETGNLDLYAKFIPIKYNIIFHGNGAEGNTESITDIDYDQSVSLPASGYTYKGFYFKGWNTKSDGSGTFYADKAEVKNLRTTAGSITLYAIWSVDENTPYTVKYVYNGLTEGSEETITKEFKGSTGSSVSPDPAEMSKTGFVTPERQNLLIGADGKSTITYLYERERHTVTAEAEKGVKSFSGTGTYRYGEKVTVIATAEEGFSLLETIIASGAQADSSTPSSCTFTVETEDISIRATAVPDNEIPYTVKHVYKGLNGDDEVRTETFAGSTNEKIIPDTIERDGFIMPEKQNATIKGDGTTCVTYIYERAKYQVAIERSIGVRNVMGEGIYRYGDTVTVTMQLEEGYTPEGFQRNGSITWDDDTHSCLTFSMGMNDEKLKAVAKPTTYTITYELFDGKMTGNVLHTYTHGQRTPLPDASAMSKPCEQFLGWFTDNNCEGEAITEIKETDVGNKVFYAKWGPSDYSVAFDTQGGTINSGIFDTYMYGIGAKLPTDVTKDGYTFLGWKQNGVMATSIGPNDYGRKNYIAVWRSNASARVEDIAEEERTDKTTVKIASSKTNAGDYYYSQLTSGTEKAIYDTLYRTYKFQPSKGDDQNYEPISLQSDTNFTVKDVSNAQAALIWDHPEIFWVRYFGKSSVWQEDGAYLCNIYPKEAYSEKRYRTEMQTYQESLNYAKKMEIGITSKDSNYAKLKKIHDYIAKYYRYDDYGITLTKKTSDDTRSAGHMLLNRSGCCEGYAKLTKILCNEYGIPCILVCSENHMWNQVKLDGKWYGLDVTWDDTPKGTSYAFFLKGKNIFAKASEHKVANAFYQKADGTPITSYGCFKVPALSSDYSAPDTGKSSSGNKLKKGTTFKNGKLIYTVTSLKGKKGSACVKKAAKKTEKSIAIPASIKKSGITLKVTEIKASAFKGMKKLTKAIIGKNVTTIGKNAFASDKQLKKIAIKGKKLKEVGKKAFFGIKKNATIKVPKGKKSTYRKLLKKKGLKNTTKVK